MICSIPLPFGRACTEVPASRNHLHSATPPSATHGKVVILHMQRLQARKQLLQTTDQQHNEHSTCSEVDSIMNVPLQKNKHPVPLLSKTLSKVIAPCNNLRPIRNFGRDRPTPSLHVGLPPGSACYIELAHLQHIALPLYTNGYFHECA